MKNVASIIYLTGKPGVGKYTIAKETAQKNDFIICDNQLINNPIFELLQYDGYTKIPAFAWEAIAKIRTNIYDFLTKVPENNYVLTNCLDESLEDRALYEQVESMAIARSSLFVPVQLKISKEEHLKRLTNPERRKRWKSIDPQEAEDNGPLLSISHHNVIELEISNLSPQAAAKHIMNHINGLPD